MSEKQQITEEMKIHEEWYKSAKEITVSELPEFVRHLTEDYIHDYGTICHAVSAAGIAAMHAVDHSPTGGITGFQASCIMWEVMQRWMNFSGPMRLVRFEDMLYPQYDDKFEKTISKETWLWLQAEAQKRLDERELVRHEVKKHWLEIVSGKIPFGYSIVE